MTEWWKKISTKRPWWVLGVSILLLLLLGWYAAGLFGALKDDDGFAAKGTQSQKVAELLSTRFSPEDTSAVILFERNDGSLGDATSDKYQAAVMQALRPLALDSSVKSVTTYQTQPQEAFISKDKKSTYALVTFNTDAQKAYRLLEGYQKAADQAGLKISIGGDAVANRQTNDAVGHDLKRVEVVTMPVLLILLLLFFRSAVAASVPLAMSAVTIVGAFAITRLCAQFLQVDTYAVNVITILGIGLSIDYALLSVNRFREELHSHGSVERATRTIIDTSGRTIFFSAITVIACLLALLVFPMDFLHSIAIGGASAVVMAMLFTVLTLPAVLMLIGKRIDRLHLPTLRKKNGAAAVAKSRFWEKVAHVTTTRPIVSLVVGLVVVAIAAIPLAGFKAVGIMDFRWMAQNVSSKHVAERMSQDFNLSSPTYTAVLDVPKGLSRDETTRLSCDMTTKLMDIRGVQQVMSATPLEPGMTCEAFWQAEQAGVLPAEIRRLSEVQHGDHALKFNVYLPSEKTAAEKDDILLALRELRPSRGTWLVGGEHATSFDTSTSYLRAIPWAVVIVVVSMIVLLSLLLASLTLPLQAIVVNTIALCVSLALVVGIFMHGWFSSITGWEQASDGLVYTPLILTVAIAFGLAMDYSVFLYSRMREIYDLKADPLLAVREGIVKTGPIITAAAIMMFVVVIAFAGSSVMIMQIIGIGLGIAVLVDAFFVRLILVPSIMTLMGRASWYAPRWLRRLRIRHE